MRYVVSDSTLVRRAGCEVVQKLYTEVGVSLSIPAGKDGELLLPVGMWL